MDIRKSDYCIIGAGIIGLAIARELQSRHPRARISIIEKEADVALHASGRNSGVLHAGFYYTADSLKARFTRAGNAAMRAYCKKNKLKVNECAKVVVAANESEFEPLLELERRGKKNGVRVRLISEKELWDIDPNVITRKKALYSPTTATVDPGAVCRCLRDELIDRGVSFSFGSGYRCRVDEHTVETVDGARYTAKKIINCGGLYADRIARDFNFSAAYTMIPFKGIYLKYTMPDKPIRTNVYPVPNLKNPFLGVHYTITVDNTIKIGPTAIPAFWRENYHGLDNFNFKELAEVLRHESNLFLNNSFNFRSLAIEEMKKYYKGHLVDLARTMLRFIDGAGFTEWSKPGIRAQLLNVKTRELVQDFVVEGDRHSVHVLNAVSPAFTSSFPFAEWVVNNYV